MYYVSMPGCAGWHWTLWTGKHSKVLAGHVGENLKSREDAEKSIAAFKLLVATAQTRTFYPESN